MTDQNADQDTPVARDTLKGWLHHPDLPIQMSPAFTWPMDFKAVLAWFTALWLQFSAMVIVFACALIGAAVLPSFADMKSLSLGWVAQIWLRNVLLLILIAGGLHFWFFTIKGQGRAFKFDQREQATNNKQFLFRNQVHENVFFTLVSGAGLISAYEIGYFWAAANGFAPLFFLTLSNPMGILWFLVLMLVIPIWSSFHFYWVHRLLHWPLLYKLAHGLHHKNINVGPWSGVSMHPVEHVLYYSSLLVHFVVPTHPILFVFHVCYLNLGPPFSHSGFEQIVVRDKDRLKAGDFFHQLHHRFFECNYGTVEMPWDRWFGSFDNGTPESRARQQERMKGHKR